MLTYHPIKQQVKGRDSRQAKWYPVQKDGGVGTLRRVRGADDGIKPGVSAANPGERDR